MIQIVSISSSPIADIVSTVEATSSSSLIDVQRSLRHWSNIKQQHFQSGSYQAELHWLTGTSRRLPTATFIFRECLKSPIELDKRGRPWNRPRRDNWRSHNVTSWYQWFEWSCSCYQYLQLWFLLSDQALGRCTPLQPHCAWVVPNQIATCHASTPQATKRLAECAIAK